MPAPTAKSLSQTHAFSGCDLPMLLAARAESRADHPFLIWEPFDGPAVTWTYKRFADKVAIVAAGLQERGIGMGDFVLIHMNNCPEFLLAWHACSRLGAVAVTTNTRSVQDDLEYFIGHCGAVAALTQPRFAEVVRASGPNLKWIACTDTDSGALPECPRPDWVVAFEAIEADPASLPRRAPDPMAFNSIQYTSGTTSRPKGVVWTHANTLWGARVNASHWELGEDDVTSVYLPLFHANAICWSMLPVLWSGSTMVLQPRFSSSRFWDIALKYRCTWANMVPFTMKAILGLPTPKNHHYRFWGTGYADHPAVIDGIGTRSMGLWGMTETITAPIFGDFRLPNQAQTMGRAMPEYEIKVVDDDGNEVSYGEVGRLLLRGIPGLSIFFEYLNDPEATAEAFDVDGWFDTGDLVTPFADGCMAFTDRAKDMLKVGGENVATMEVERVIMGVAGVEEVAVVGKPHDMLDEVPVAFVIPSAGVEDLEKKIDEVCREMLADFKVPREIILIDKLPRATVNKVSKKELRTRFQKSG